MSAENRPWTAFYGPGVRTDIEQASYRTIGDLIRSVAETYDTAPAFTACMPNGMNGTLTYAQVDEMSDALRFICAKLPG